MERVIAHLKNWQKCELEARRSTSARCLEAVRWALKQEGFQLPLSYVDYPTAFALDCFYALLKAPHRWGWK